MIWIASINGKISGSSGSLTQCTNCPQLFWAGWDTCPNCKQSIYEQKKVESLTDEKVTPEG